MNVSGTMYGTAFLNRVLYYMTLYQECELNNMREKAGLRWAILFMRLSFIKPSPSVRVLHYKSVTRAVRSGTIWNFNCVIEILGEMLATLDAGECR